MAWPIIRVVVSVGRTLTSFLLHNCLPASFLVDCHIVHNLLIFTNIFLAGIKVVFYVPTTLAATYSQAMEILQICRVLIEC